MLPNTGLKYLPSNEAHIYKNYNAMRVNNSKTKYKFCNRNSDGDNTIPGKYMETKTELQRFYTQEAAKSALKTKIQYAEEGEKSTRYFYSLERQKQSKQTINVLTKMNLDTITEPHDIITESYNFYKSLYTAQPTDPHQQTDFLSIETPTLTTHDRNLCEGYLTEHELQKGLQTMENNKSPGLDVLSTNFYKHFWSLLRTELTHIYSYAYEQGHLSLSQQRGVITLLLKKGDRTKLQNWCPITLTTKF